MADPQHTPSKRRNKRKSTKDDKAPTATITSPIPNGTSSPPATNLNPLSPHLTPLSPPLPPTASPPSSAPPSAAPNSASAASQLHAVHRCRFVEFMPAAITALAFSPYSNTLAVGRGNGDIQLYHTSPHTLHYKTLPGTGQSTVQSLMWTRSPSGEERLLSAGLNARLIEWDLTRLIPRHATDSYGGAVWSASLLHGYSLAQQVAAGEGASVDSVGHSEYASSVVLACEDGTLRLFDTSDPTTAPTYIKSLSRHSSRALTAAWYDALTVVSGGSDGSVRVWDVLSGRNTTRISVGGEAVNVWSVACVEGRIVSGDSVGAISVWDYHYGTLLQRLLHHKADVLSLSVTADGATIYSASVDATVSQCQLLSSGQYVMAAPLRDHTHDVNVVTVGAAEGLVASGGEDTVLVLRRVGEVKAAKLLPFPHSSIVSVANGMFLVRQNKRLSLYQLPNLHTSRPSDNTIAAIDNDDNTPPKSYTHLLNIDTEGSQTSAEQAWTTAPLNLTCAALSPTATHIVCSTPLLLRLYRLSLAPLSLLPVREAGAVLPPASAVGWSAEGGRLIVGGLDGRLVVYDVGEGRVEASVRFHQGEEDEDDDDQDDDDAVSGGVVRVKRTGVQKRGAIQFVAVSCDGQYVTAADEHNNINAFRLPSLTFHHTHPLLPSPLTTLTPHPSSPSTLLLTTASNHLHVYCLRSLGFTAWSRRLQAAYPAALLERKERVVAVSVEEGGGEDSGRVLMASESWLCVVELGNDVSVHSGVLRKDRRKQQQQLSRRGGASALIPLPTAPQPAGNDNFRLITRYKPLLYGGFMPRPHKTAAVGAAAGTSTEGEAAEGGARKGKKRKVKGKEVAVAVVEAGKGGQGEGEVRGGPQDLLVVECPWLRVLQSLPEPMERKKYGT